MADAREQGEARALGAVGLPHLLDGHLLLRGDLVELRLDVVLADDEIEIAVQVLGKVRGHAKVANGAANDVVLAAARAAVAAWLDGKLLVKEIVVPGKLVNFVVK